MGSSHVANFNYWVVAAQNDLAGLSDTVSPAVYGSRLRMAEDAMVRALRAANKAGCRARKSVCLRVLNWIRADLRRAA